MKDQNYLRQYPEVPDACYSASEVPCTTCTGKGKITGVTIDVTIKGVPCRTNTHYYKCEKCSEVFTTPQLDEQNIKNLTTLENSVVRA